MEFPPSILLYSQQKYTQQRDQLLQTQQKVDKGTASLQRAQQQLVESQQIGTFKAQAIKITDKALPSTFHVVCLARFGGSGNDT